MLVDRHENPITESSSEALPRLLLRPTEAALVLGVSRATIYRLLDDGSLGSVWVRTSRRFPMAEAERYARDLRLSVAAP